MEYPLPPQTVDLAGVQYARESESGLAFLIKELLVAYSPGYSQWPFKSALVSAPTAVKALHNLLQTNENILKLAKQAFAEGSTESYEAIVSLGEL
jgi:hypothetical protein